MGVSQKNNFIFLAHPIIFLAHFIFFWLTLMEKIIFLAHPELIDFGFFFRVVTVGDKMEPYSTDIVKLLSVKLNTAI